MHYSKALLPLSFLVLAAVPASAQTIQLNLLADINMNGGVSATALPTSVGTDISAIAWDGTNLYVGGYNNSASSANIGIVAVDNALTAPTLGATFAPIVSIGSSRGYSEMAIQSGQLIASADSGSGSGISDAAYTASTGSLLWTNGSGNGNSAASLTLRGNGIGFDPGYVAGGTPAPTVDTLTIGSGRRIAFASTTGTYVYSQSGGPAPNGAVINFTGSNGVTGGGTSWRSLAFDPTTGDEYARNENLIIKITRTGDNTIGSSTILDGTATAGGSFATASSVDNQNIAFVNSSVYGNFVIANDHTSNASGQSAASIIKAASITNPGTLLGLSFSNALPTSAGAYNFSFDAASQTLAMSDFANNHVYIYSLGASGGAATPDASTGILLAIGTLSLGLISGRSLAKRHTAPS